MPTIKSLILISIISGFTASCFAMVVDNRYFPLFPEPYTRTTERPSRFGADFFFMTSDKGYGDREEDVGLPEIFGRYDQAKESQAMVAIGLPSPLLDEWRSFDIRWAMEGKLQAQGISFCYDQGFLDNWWIGATWLFMRVDSWQDFFFNETESTIRLSPADRIELDEERRQMNSVLGIRGPHAHQSGFGDVDLYLRYGSVREYIYKFRRMDLGIKGGILFPSGVSRDINSPASVPFGGNGFWGVYAQAEGEFELKEDLIAGIQLRASKRFARTKLERVTAVLSTEPQELIENSLLYGVIVAPIRVDPGVTVMFSPYVTLENIRAGLGARVRYILAIHEADSWSDRRPLNQRTVPIARATLAEKLGWASDYVELMACYDFGKIKVDQGMSPTVTLTWDLPALLFEGRNISKTHKIALGLKVYF